MIKRKITIKNLTESSLRAEPISLTWPKGPGFQHLNKNSATKKTRGAIDKDSPDKGQ
jgi:hypothetical protein